MTDTSNDHLIRYMQQLRLENPDLSPEQIMALAISGAKECAGMIADRVLNSAQLKDLEGQTIEQLKIQDVEHQGKHYQEFQLITKSKKYLILRSDYVPGNEDRTELKFNDLSITKETRETPEK